MGFDRGGGGAKTVVKVETCSSIPLLMDTNNELLCDTDTF